MIDFYKDIVGPLVALGLVVANAVAWTSNLQAILSW